MRSHRRLSLSLYDSGVSRDDLLGSADLSVDCAAEGAVQVGVGHEVD